MSEPIPLDSEEARNALLDIYERAVEGDEALQRDWPELEAVVNEEIRDRMEVVHESLTRIYQIATECFGGINTLLQAQAAREEQRETKR